MTQLGVVRTNFETSNARDFDAFEENLAPDMTFEGPMAAASGAAEARQGIEGMRQTIEIVATAGDGADVITWFLMHRPERAPMSVDNWSQVADAKVAQVRVTFDPRPLLS